MNMIPAVRTRVAGMLFLAAVCALPSRGAGAGDGAVLNGIHGTTAAAKAAKGRPDTARSVSPRAGSGRVRAGVGAWKTPPIDVRALSAAEPRAAAEAAPAILRPVASGGGLPVVLAAFFVAACSTALVLFFVHRVSRRERTAPATAACPQKAADRAAPLPDGREFDGEGGIPVAEVEECFDGVGRELRSSRAEFALAMKLHSGALGDDAGRRARSACRADATTAERVKVARRLGIGRGEIDLALRLQKLGRTSAEGENA